MGLGELVWDLFPDGPRLGGAPANVAYHAHRQGAKGLLATAIGHDLRGEQALTELSAFGLDTTLIQKNSLPTGTVGVEFDGSEPRFRIDSHAAWTAIEPTPALLQAAGVADAICFGTLLQAFSEGRHLLAEVAPLIELCVVDLNLRPPFDTDEAIASALRFANVVKLSETEARHLEIHPRELIEQGALVVAITRGAMGSVIFTAEGYVEHPGYPLQSDEGDAVGAGDAFTAALTVALLDRRSAAEAQDLANRYAAQVASHRGAMGLRAE